MALYPVGISILALQSISYVHLIFRRAILPERRSQFLCILFLFLSQTLIWTLLLRFHVSPHPASQPLSGGTGGKWLASTGLRIGKSCAAQRRYRYNENMVNWEALEKIGVSKASLEQQGLLDCMLKGYKTNKLVPLATDPARVGDRPAWTPAFPS